MEPVPSLLRLRAHPRLRPDVWAAAVEHAGPATVVVDVAGGPGSGRDPAYTAAITRLAATGVRVLGYVDLGFATRSVRALVDDVHRWAGYPVCGVFFDHAPGSPFAVGAVATAVRAARRTDLADIVLNPAAPPDPVYRGLGTLICVFDGGWEHYRQWSPEGTAPGDGHLVRRVPPEELHHAQRLLAERGAGLGVVVEAGTTPVRRTPAGVAVGSAGRSTTIGS